MISDMLSFPFSMLDDDMEKLFYPDFFQRSRGVARSGYPAINIGTTDKSVEVYLFVPGMNADDLEVVIEKNMLSVAGERKLPEVANEKNVSYRQERFDGHFKRAITLPESVDTESAEATYKNGALNISIAKRAESQPRKIKISVK